MAAMGAAVPDLLKAAERLAKTVRTGILAAVENVAFLLRREPGVRMPPCAACGELCDPCNAANDLANGTCLKLGLKQFAAGETRSSDWLFNANPVPGGFACLAPPFECLGCVTTSDCTWPHKDSAVPAAEPSPIPPGDEGPVSVTPTAHGAPNVYVVTEEVMEAIHLLHDAGISPEIYQLLNPEK